MLLLLMRHAAAAERDPDRYPDDSRRPLVPSGRAEARRVLRRLARTGMAPARILSSPWKRAWQTARIVRDTFDLPGEARVRCDALAASPDVQAIAMAVGDVDADATIALVGHEPWIGELAALLLTGSASGVAIRFAKSAVLGARTDRIARHAATLEFLLVP
ncbi:MAG: SixA phosphatase family protein [Gemmatimonadales bacterium]